MRRRNNDRPKYYSSIYSYDNNFSCGDNYNNKKSKQRKKKERFKMKKYSTEREMFEDWIDRCPVIWEKKWGEDTYYFDVNDEIEEEE